MKIILKFAVYIAIALALSLIFNSDVNSKSNKSSRAPSTLNYPSEVVVVPSEIYSQTKIKTLVHTEKIFINLSLKTNP